MIPLLLVIPVIAVIALAPNWQRPKRQSELTVAFSVAQLVAALFVLSRSQHPTMYRAGGWPAPIGITLRLDMLSAIMVCLTAFIMTAATLYHMGETSRGRKGTENPIYHLTFPLLTFALTGVFLTHDLFNFYIFFELVAVSSYILVSSGKYHPLEAAWKYAIQSVLGSTALLIGVALVYARAGTLDLTELAARPGASLGVAAPFVLGSFLLKSSLFPFHLWQQDAHAAASSPGSAILAGLLIKVGLYGFLRIWPPLFGQDYHEWLMVLGGISIVFGALAAWNEEDVKRLLGFSSVSQMGFVLLAVGWGTLGAETAAIFFVIHHSLTKALLFLATGALSDARGTAKRSSLLGAGRSLPWLQASFLVGGFSLVGLPPTVGLLAKIGLVLEGLRSLNDGSVVVVLVGSLMTLAYVLRTHRGLFWEGSRVSKVRAGAIPAASTAAIGVLTASVILGGAFGGKLVRLCELGAHQARMTQSFRAPASKAPSPTAPSPISKEEDP